MLSQKNKTHVIVGKDDNLATSSETRANLIAGQIGVFKNGSAVATTSALSAGDKFKIVYMNTDGYIIESPMYDYSLLLNKKAATYVAGTEQKTYVGYNGSTGSIAVANSDVYHIHMTRRDSSATLAEHGFFKLVAAYQSDASATQTEIADALVLNAVKNFEVEKAKSGITVTKVGRINSSAVTAANDLVNNATVVNGTKTITVSTAITWGTVPTTLVVGDYLRIGSVGGGTALTNQVYKITAINGLVLTLDRPVLEASGTYAAATHDIEVLAAATAAAGNWGLSFESAPVKFVPGLFKYQNVTFDITLSEAFGSTLITDSTAPTKGTGTYKEVAEIEWELRGNRGEGYKVASYPVSQNLNATSGKTYNVISLQFANDNATSLDGNVRSWHSLLIFTEVESSSTVHTDLKTVLNIS